MLVFKQLLQFLSRLFNLIKWHLFKWHSTKCLRTNSPFKYQNMVCFFQTSTEFVSTGFPGTAFFRIPFGFLVQEKNFCFRPKTAASGTVSGSGIPTVSGKKEAWNPGKGCARLTWRHFGHCITPIAGNAYWRERISTNDLLVLTSSLANVIRLFCL